MGQNGGKRPGAGRKPGTKNPATLEKERVLGAVRQRIMGFADVIVDGQLSLARGQQFLYKIEKEKIIGPKGGVSYRRLPPKLVTNQFEIESYLEGKVSEGDEYDDQDPGATYYFITTKEPNNNAVDSLLDRAFGKSVAAVELTGKDGKPLFDDDTREKQKRVVDDFLAGNAGQGK